ncbi:rRNA maturation RNase YbeY [Roseitranquillus sediminis]|uniref:rRNA maturation RNase YbeY n=1 Tax=Roseitranquillus sediminis TaxID=2809051 RepID=UPI001D0BFB89|nr:rRNA maturation RNase YbeY [Roseitranquillus sediminis]MBM9593072.1 rRNA maturation RNase YbeY [Roseitranquillus sediminis]
MVDAVLEDDRWAMLQALADRACDATLRHQGLDPDAWEIVVMGCSDARIAELNAQFRGKEKPTNVLSWPSEERGAAQAGAKPEPPRGDSLGDIALAWETCEAEARAAGKPFEEHVAHLLVHGTLHLLGYDHEDEADAQLMERVEVEVLATLGLADPYSA